MDGKPLGLRYRYDTSKSRSPRYKGIANVKENGAITFRALRFVKPSLLQHNDSAADGSYSDAKALGSLEINVYEATPTRDASQKESLIIKGFGAPKVARSSDVVGLSKKNCLRSATGKASVASRVGHDRYKQHSLLETVTIKYCATPGLIRAGVVPCHGIIDQAPSVEITLSDFQSLVILKIALIR